MAKKNTYHITLNWYVESDLKLSPRSKDSDERILDVLRHRLNGTTSCSSCPTRTPNGYTIAKTYNKNPGDKIYMSVDSIVKENN